MIQFKDEELQEVARYMDELNSGEYTQYIKDHRFTTKETDYIFPLIRKLLTYGLDADNSDNGSDLKPDYETIIRQYDYFNGSARDLASQKPQVLKSLITKYKTVVKEEATRKLFNKKIVEMNGYEFRDYLRELGIIS